MGRKRKLRKQMYKRGLDDKPAIVICVGKRCCPRAESRALAEKTFEYADEKCSTIPVVTVGCLDICKKGPIAAAWPTMKFKKHATLKKTQKLLAKLERGQ